MADVDNSAWDAAKAWANGAASDDPAAFYNGICAGKKAGDPATQGAHALPHHYHPGDPPNANGTSNALSRLPTTQGLTNAAAAKSHLEAHMKVINPDYEPSKSAAQDLLRTLRRRSDMFRQRLQAADFDESAGDMVLALDATLDQALALLSGAGSLDPDAVQAMSLLVAAEALADDLLELLGIADPGDADTGQAAMGGIAVAQAAAASLPRPVAARVRPANARQVAQMRAEGMRGQRRGQFPSGAARMVPAKATLRHEQTTHNGKIVQALYGYATVYELEYEMWDAFGPYGEHVAMGAGAASLAAKPDVAFLVNHRGMTMARTTNETLGLKEDARGLNVDPALLNPERHDVHDLLVAIDDKNVTEMSFAFMITAGGWDEDFEHFTIEAYDIDRGDVSAVNYGANPYTSIGARSREIMGDLRHMPAGAQRAAYDVLAEILTPYRIKPSPAPEPELEREVQSEPPASGWSVDYATQLVALDVELS